MLEGIFLSACGNLTRSDFDNLNLFQSQKQHSINSENRLKSKLAWPVCAKSMLKWKWYRSNDCSKKLSFYWVITWKLLFSGRGRNKNLVWGSILGEYFSWWDGGWEANFKLVRELPLIPPLVGKNFTCTTSKYLLYIIINCTTSMVNQQLVSYNGFWLFNYRIHFLISKTIICTKY